MLINMNIGGTEKALLNMINEIPPEKYEITIFMLEKYGGFLDQIPEKVNVKYFSGYKDMKDLLNQPPQKMSLSLAKKGKLLKVFNIMVLHLITKLLKDRSLFFKYLLRNYPILKEEYDVAVAYDGPMDFISYFVLRKINAKKKYQWIHFDVTKIGFNQKFAAKIYHQFNKVFVVSMEAKEKLVKLLPSLEAKMEVFHNIVSPSLIDHQGKKGKGFDDHFDGIRILTVGRLSKEKGQDLAIKAFAKLINDGFKIRWYCLGEGKYREECQRLIDEYNLKGKFILLGSDPNPYAYMEQCDIYVQPSRYEGYCITLMEARCLRKPIITTDVNGAKEQIQNGENGLIVGIDTDEIYLGLRKLLLDSRLREKFSIKLANEDIIIADDQMMKFFNVIH